MRAWTADRRAGLGAAIALPVVIAIADLLLPDSTELIPLLVAGPLLAVWLTGPGETLVASVAAVAAAILVGAAESMFLTQGHVVGVIAVAVGGMLAVLVARSREA